MNDMQEITVIGEYDRKYQEWTESAPTSIPGIVITDYYRRKQFHNGFPVLTHEVSGHLIGGPYENIDQARAIAGALSGLGNWNKRLGYRDNNILQNVRHIPELRKWLREIRRPQVEVPA